MRALLFIIAAVFATVTAAQVRPVPIPADAKRAEMSHISENQVSLNGQPAQLSPGAQIRDPLNRIIMPATLPPGSIVKYQLDAAGLVHRVWILTPEEADKPDQ